MAIYVEINEVRYPASISGRVNDNDWNNRESKFIELEMTYEKAKELFVDNVAWSIVQEVETLVEKIDDEGNIVVDENGEPILEQGIVLESYDNSDFCIAGSITDNRDGTIIVKMGKFTNEELLIMEVLA